MKLLKYMKKSAAFGLIYAMTLSQTAYAAVTTAPVLHAVINNEASAITASISKPEIQAQGACLIDASTGQVLFGKNQDTQFFPASITKVMTALVVLENCNLNDIVTFSETATTNLESGAVSLGISAGDQLTVEQSLYGLLLKSANEIGNGLAEHVAGSVSAFADKMNQKAVSIGCKNTHFANPHGLNDTTHVTTPYDMCQILRAALQNENFRKIDTTTSYQFPAVKNAASKTITMGHKMMYKTDSRYYEGIIGGKTGYTSKAGNTLVTGAERNGVRLVACVMKSNGTHYTDTKALLDYGFKYYAALTGNNVSAAENIVSAGTQAAETQTVETQAVEVQSPVVQQTAEQVQRGPAFMTPALPAPETQTVAETPAVTETQAAAESQTVSETHPVVVVGEAPRG